MPRYCAVKGCRNRGGTSSRQEDKRISFYPFPLQDKPRLHKWVANMNRRGWTPSRHQYLCSEHFTQSCFDIRWGIRYLKQTAIPTIFPADNNVCICLFLCLCNQIPNNTLFICLYFFLLQQQTSDFEEFMESSSKKCKEGCCRIGDDGMLAGSDIKEHPLDRLHTKAQLDSAVVELCCDASALTDTADLQTAPGQTFLEENSTARESSGGGRASADEHSYCRAEDMARDQLWCKVLCLNAQIMELERREQNTVAKIQALETEIALLQRDNLILTFEVALIDKEILSN
uniref:THAP domain-containing protein 5 n=1 Tax=Oryzias sinensis TaxID=183150 RepID=A0A8C7WSR3_9TELE